MIGWLLKGRLWLPFAVLVVGALFPFFTDSGYYISVGSLMLFAIIGAYAFWLPWQLRLLSLGHIAFMGIGAYTTAYLTTQQDWPFWATIPLAGLTALAAATLLGLVTLRLQGIYFAMASFVFLELFQATLREWRAVTNGPSGIAAIPRPETVELGFISLNFGNLEGIYYMALILTVAIMAMTARLMSSRIGLNIHGIAGSERLALSVGVSVFRYRLLVLGLSALWVGVAGAIFAGHTRFVSPQNFNVQANLDWMIYAVVGGLYSFPGPLLGAGILEGLTQVVFTTLGVYRLFLYGGLLMVVALYLNGGIAGTGEIVIGFLSRQAQRLRTSKEAPHATASAPPGSETGS